MTRQAREQFVATLAMLTTLALGGALVGGLSGGLLVPVAAVLVMALAKARYVVLDFMELRDDKSGLRLAMLAWPALLLSLALLRSIAVALAG